MASIRITIKTDNAAFFASANKGDDVVISACRAYSDRGLEVARILRIMADEFEHTGTADHPRNETGALVGKVEEIE